MVTSRRFGAAPAGVEAFSGEAQSGEEGDEGEGRNGEALHAGPGSLIEETGNGVKRRAGPPLFKTGIMGMMRGI